MDIIRWIEDRIAFIHGCRINGDDLSQLSVRDMLYLYGEILQEFGVQISPECIENDVFSSLNRLTLCVEELLRL